MIDNIPPLMLYITALEFPTFFQRLLEASCSFFPIRSENGGLRILITNIVREKDF